MTDVNDSTSQTQLDLYKDSFKYFRQFSTPIITQTPRLNKKVKGRGRASLNRVECSILPNIIKCETKDSDAHCNENKSDSKALYSRDDVLFRRPNEDESSIQNYLKTRDLHYDESLVKCECHKMWGLRSPDTWEVTELTFPSGLIVIKNPFTSEGQRYWISRTLLDFPHHSVYITNMDNLNRLEKIKKGENVDKLEDFKLNTSGRDFYQTLRWVTFGYHHDWDTKIYSEERRSDFPEDLGDMTGYIAQILGFANFKAEAAIANYYHMDSTLSGHIDKSEVNQYAPLFSLSFGQSCIFLIGGKTKAERPQPVLLQSGDVAVMSGESRLSYHGVPAILSAASCPWEDEDSGQINSGLSTENFKPSWKKPKLENITNLHNCESFRMTLSDPNVLHKINNTKWTTFLDEYIRKSRINLNIRQVLFPGQATLSDNSTISKTEQ